ncbi:MAG TPA: diguanylate cyclase, partial [Lacipirellula sp.]
PNRRTFDARLAECLAEFESSHKPFSLVMLDVDFFKQFNDAHGHVAGDEALRTLARTLPQHIKRSDVVCRFGGEEFAIVLRGARVLEAQAAANRLRAAVEAMPIDIEGHSLRITISLGVAEAMPGEDARRIVSWADECVYASKRVGRNCTHWHNGTDCVFASERRAKAFDRGRSVAQRLSRLWRHRGEDRLEALPIITDPAVLVTLLQRRIAEAARSDEPLSVLLFTLPAFEALKQRIGEGEAGRIESQMVSALADAVRDMDYIGRLSEAEYAILLPRCTESAARIVAQRLTALVKSALGSETGWTKDVEPAVAIAPVVHPITAEQVLEAARKQLVPQAAPAAT